MSNEEILEKMKEDMKLRDFSHYSFDTYTRKICKLLNKEELSAFFEACD